MFCTEHSNLRTCAGIFWPSISDKHQQPLLWNRKHHRSGGSCLSLSFVAVRPEPVNSRLHRQDFCSSSWLHLKQTKMLHAYSNREPRNTAIKTIHFLLPLKMFHETLLSVLLPYLCPPSALYVVQENTEIIDILQQLSPIAAAFLQVMRVCNCWSSCYIL